MRLRALFGGHKEHCGCQGSPNIGSFAEDRHATGASLVGLAHIRTSCDAVVSELTMIICIVMHMTYDMLMTSRRLHIYWVSRLCSADCSTFIVAHHTKVLLADN